MDTTRTEITKQDFVNTLTEYIAPKTGNLNTPTKVCSIYTLSFRFRFAQGWAGEGDNLRFGGVDSEYRIEGSD